MIDVGMFDKTIEEIKDKLLNGKPQEPLARNLRLLLAMACHDKTKYMPIEQENTVQKYDASIKVLEVANAFAYDAVTDSSPFAFDIPRLIDEICTSVSQSVESGEISLDDGINLAQRLCTITPLGKGVICNQVMEILLEIKYGH
jgi:hypothetical protein